MINEIVRNIKVACAKNKVPMPDIFTEFGRGYTVGESMAHIYSVIGEKQQNDREIWYMIDSFLLPHCLIHGVLVKNFCCCPSINGKRYQRVTSAGNYLRQHDYYDSEENILISVLQSWPKEEPYT